ncbi:portal protein [Sulfurovum sp.]|uniref:portal protein n=1 Tax=Sulfurovum sp. TaxID=1969726 RepID=UPI00356A1160
MAEDEDVEMKSTTSGKDIVKEAKKRFKRAQDYYSDARDLAIEDTKFAMGDSTNGWQWPDSAKSSRESADKVCLTVNQTAQHCNQIINNIRVNRPAVKVSGVDDFSDKKTAEILAGLIRNIQVSSSSDDAHDTAAEHAVYGGEGYWRILTEYESDDSFDQVITIKSIPNPNLVYIDPDAKNEDRSDAKWGFIFEDVPKSDIESEYPDIKVESWEEDVTGSKWVGEHTVRRAEYFYCEREEDTLYLLADGTTVSKNDGGEPEEYVADRKVNRRKWKWCKLVGGHDEPIDSRDWLGQYLPIITVVGKEVNVDGEIVRKGIVRDLKDPARMVNYAYSETVQTLALQNRVPYLYAAEAVEGHEEVWQSANIDNQVGLPYNAFDAEGNQLPAPARQSPPVMAQAQIQLLQMSSEQMRASSGQQNANFGIRSEAQSGIGIQRLKVQGETATFHFPDNLARALRYEAKVIIDLIQKYYDSERVVRILGLDGKEDKAMLDPNSEQAYKEQRDLKGQVRKIFNPTVGRYDVVIDTGPSFQTQRQEAAANLNDIAARNPQMMSIAGDLIMEAQDFPMADKLSKRLAKAVPPELLDDDDGEGIPPAAKNMIMQAQQQMQQMDAAINELMDKNEQLEAELKSRQQDNETKLLIQKNKSETELEKSEIKNIIDEYKAETQRMSELTERMDERMIERIVTNTIASMNKMQGGPEVEVDISVGQQD